MKEIELVVCSDSHGDKQCLEFLRHTYSTSDYFIHCGDSELYPYELEGFVSVQGNNDFFHVYPNFKVLQIADHTIYLCHGNREIVASDYTLLAERAKSMQCDIALCGHTHIPYDAEIDGVRCLNPGSLRRNRDGSAPSYYVVSFIGSSISVQKKNYLQKF